MQQLHDDLKKMSSQLINYKYPIQYNKKNNSYLVKDGIVTYKATIYPDLKCQCGKSYCFHILNVLKYSLGMSDLSITFIEKFKAEFMEAVKKNSDVEAIMSVEINKYLESEVCGICLSKLGDKELHQCPKCNKMTHSKCFTKWQNTNKSILCIYCKQLLF